MKLLVGGTKGGGSKSTTAQNLSVLLAHQGIEVMLLDADMNQNTSAKWVARREKEYPDLPKLFCTQKNGDVKSTIESLRSKYGAVVVDAGGYDSSALRSAMLTVDVFCIPVLAAQFDIETFEYLVPIIETAKIYNPNMRVVTFISKVPSHKSSEREIVDAIEMLSQLPPSVSLCNTIIKDRIIYRDVSKDGRGVFESDNKAAIEEMVHLGEEIFNHG